MYLIEGADNYRKGSLQMSNNTSFDIAAFDLHFDAVFARHLANGAYPEDALFGFNLERFFRAGWKTPLADIDSLRNLVNQYGTWDSNSKRLGTHLRIAPLTNRDYGRSSQFGFPDTEAGKLTDALGLPCLVMDFDTEDGAHAPLTGTFEGYRHPTRQEIADLIADVMPDTFRTNTGGGIQSVFALAEPMDSQDPGMKALRQRFQTRWADAAKERGFGLDMSVGVKATQTQRMAGSVNWKRDGDPRPVTVLKEDDGTVYSTEQLLLELPEPERVERIRPKAAGRARRVWAKDADTFAANIPVSFLMEEVWAMEERVTESADTETFGRWSFPREDGTCSQDTHAATTTNDRGIQIAFAHGARLQGAWGVDSASTPVNSWDLLMVAVGFNRGIAETIAAAFAEPDGDLVESLLNYMAYLEETAA